jgi:hypothetical protein
MRPIATHRRVRRIKAVIDPPFRRGWRRCGSTVRSERPTSVRNDRDAALGAAATAAARSRERGRARPRLPVSSSAPACDTTRVPAPSTTLRPAS